MKSFVLDIETNKLINPDTIWCVVVEDLWTEEPQWEFTDPTKFKRFIEGSPNCKWTGHNIIEFDAPILKELWDIELGERSLIDTLLLSRLYSPKLEGGHSLEAWGERLNYPKLMDVEFSEFNPKILERCSRDVSLNKILYKHLYKKLGEKKADFAIELEHRIALALKDAKKHGFCFDKKKAIKYKFQFEEQRTLLDLDLKFPDIEKKEIFVPKKDNEKKGYKAGVPFEKTKLIPFNINSSQHIINELWKAGWQPTDKTEGHKEYLRLKEKDKKKDERYKKYGWKLSETNLATLPADAPECLKSYLKRLLYETRIRKLDEWLSLYNNTTGCIHGDILGLGTWTHRMSHRRPNLANISAKKSIKYHTAELNSLAIDLGGKLRELWIAKPNKVLVGTDAEAIQLRVLAHYMEDEEFIKAVTEGKKEDGTDPHSFNQRRIGIGTRNDAKTFIYAIILGAGDRRTGEIYNISPRDGGKLKNKYISSIPGLEKLKQERIPADCSRGFTIGFDGRKILCMDSHLMMAAYLQGGEAVIMKLATILSIDQLEKENIQADLINEVHDDMIFECSKKDAERVREITEWSIAEAGKILKLKCPMKGEGKIGRTWLEIH